MKKKLLLALITVILLFGGKMTCMAQATLNARGVVTVSKTNNGLTPNIPVTQSVKELKTGGVVQVSEQKSITFTTGIGISYGTNLVSNGDGSTLSLWDLSSGAGFVIYSPDGTIVKNSPNGGNVFDLYTETASTLQLISQTIDISSLSSDLSSGKVKATLNGYAYRLNTSAISRNKLEQLDASNAVLS